MLDNLFEGLAPINKTKLTGMSSDPRVVGSMGNPKARLQSKITLPSEISTAQVLRSQGELGQMEAELELAKEIAELEGKQAEHLVSLHQVNVSHGQKMMGLDEKIRSIDAQHSKAVSQYQLGTSQAQAYLDGYQKVYEMSAEIFG